MRKIGLFIIFLVLIFIIKSPSTVSAEELNRTLVLNDVYDLEAYYYNDNYQILEFKDYFEYLWGVEKNTIKGELQAYLFDNNIVYLLVNDGQQKIIKINNGDIEKSIIIEDTIKINKIVYDNNIFLLGNYNTSAIILELNESLQLIKKYTYGIGNNLNFIDGLKYNNKWYIIATKNGHSLNEEFKNVGNYNDTKTILIRMNNKYLIDSVLYVNNDEKREIPVFLNLYKESLYFVVNGENNNYFYKTDLNLEKCYDMGVYEEDDKILIGYNGEYLRFNVDNGLIMKEKEQSFEYDICDIKMLEIKDSYLQVYTNENNNIYKYEIEEYHINYLKEFNVGYDYGNYDFKSNLNNTDVISIKSYFSEVEVFNETEFTNNIPGQYELSLIIKRPNLDNIKMSTKVNVDQYVNIIDNGVYKTGITLKFLGVGKLNDQNISNGHIIQKEGNYVLEIQDNYGNSRKYSFTCVDNYYIGNLNGQHTNYYMEKDKSIYLPFVFNSIEKIEEIYVSGQKTEFTQEENKINLLVNSNNIYGIKEYNIDKIKINNIWYLVNNSFKIMTLKEKPKIEINEIEGDSFKLDIKVEDIDKTIQKIGIVINGKEEFNYLKDNEYSFDLNDKTNTSIDIKIYYDLGDGNIKSFSLIKLNGRLKDADDLLKLNYNITHSIENIDLEIDTNKFKNIEYLKVNSVDITKHYENYHNYQNIYISIGISFVVLLTILLIWLFKRKKKKKKI